MMTHRYGLFALLLVAAAQEKKDANDERFHPVLLSVAKSYEAYGKADDKVRFAPTLCMAPPPSPIRLSASKDPGTHGQKLYFLYAYDAMAYLKENRYQDSFKDPKKAPRYEEKPAEQVLVKQSWSCEPASKDDKPVDSVPGKSKWIKKDGEWFKAGEQKDLFIMVRFDEKTDGTDKGWVYGTVTPDRKTVTSSGKVASCMACHEKAGDGRLFGLPK
jgi:hypothetical protein